MPDRAESHNSDTAGNQSADGALIALQKEIRAHEDFDRSQSCLARVFSHFHGSYNSSLGDLQDLEAQAKSARQGNDAAKLESVAQQAQQAINRDRKEIDWQSEINTYGTGFLKTAALFAKGEAGLVATAGAYMLDEVKPGDTSSARLADAGLGLAKGLLLRTSFEALGKSTLSIAAKGTLTSLSSRGLDAALTRGNYLDDSGHFSLDAANQKVIGNLTDWRSLGADVAVYGLAHISMGKLSAVTAKSPFLSTVLTGTTFGGASGATSEILRQKDAQQHGLQSGWDVGQIIKRASIQAALDSVAAAPGGIQGDMALRTSISQHSLHQLDKISQAGNRAMNGLSELSASMTGFGQPQFAYAGAYAGSEARASRSRALFSNVMMASAVGLTDEAFRAPRDTRPALPPKVGDRGALQDVSANKPTLLDHLKQAESVLKDLRSRPINDRLPVLTKLEEHIQRLSRLPITTEQTAATALQVDELMNAHLRQINGEAQRRTAAYEKNEPEMSEDEYERYFAPQQFIEDLVTSRMKAYGWDGKNRGTRDTQNGLSLREGIGLQNRVFSSTNDVLDKGLSKNPDVIRELEKAGLSQDRALRWYGLPMREGSAADKAGADYLLINRATGEYYPFDSTAQAANMRQDALVDTQLLNKQLMFTGKKAQVPVERLPWLIATIGDDTWDRLVSNAEFRTKLGYMEATNQVVKPQLDKDMATIIGSTLASTKGLSLFEVQLPSNDPTQHPTRQLYELWRFRQQIYSGGLRDWARAISSSMGFVVQDGGLQQLSWLNLAFGRKSTGAYSTPIGINGYRR